MGKKRSKTQIKADKLARTSGKDHVVLDWKKIDVNDADIYGEHGGFSMLEELSDYEVDATGKIVPLKKPEPKQKKQKQKQNKSKKLKIDDEESPESEIKVEKVSKNKSKNQTTDSKKNRDDGVKKTLSKQKDEKRRSVGRFSDAQRLICYELAYNKQIPFLPAAFGTIAETEPGDDFNMVDEDGNEILIDPYGNKIEEIDDNEDDENKEIDDKSQDDEDDESNINNDDDNINDDDDNQDIDEFKEKNNTQENDNGEEEDEDEGVFNTEDSDDDINMDEWSFCKLQPKIIENLKTLKYSKPTEIQRKTIEVTMDRERDVVGAAETGSGKTLAFGIPIVNALMKYAQNEETKDDTRLGALILTPTRELAIQVHDHIKKITWGTGIKVAAIVGGLAKVKQTRVLGQKPQIIVATPGRMWELIETGEQHISDLTGLRFLVLDEADRMVEKGHFKEVCQLLDRLPKYEEKVEEEESDENEDESEKQNDEENDNDDDDDEDESEDDEKETNAKNDVFKWEHQSNQAASYERQTYIFSATLTQEKTNVLWKNMKRTKQTKSSLDMIKKKVKLRENYATVDLTSKIGVAKALSEAKITCLKEDKDQYLYYFLKRYPGRTLVFCNSIDCIRHIQATLSTLKIGPLTLHAKMQQRQRLKNLERFRTKEDGVLVATDVAARGLDIKGVEHVIHYQLPRNTELYIHRSGRTARAQEDGLSVMLLGPDDMQHYKTICNQLSKETEYEEFPVDRTFFPAIKKRLTVARKLDKIVHTTKKTNSNKDWRRKAAEEMDIIISDSESDSDDQSEKRRVDRQKEALQKQLDLLLKEPLIPKTFNKSFISTQGVAAQLAKTSGDIVVDQEKQKALSVLTGKGKKRTFGRKNSQKKK